MYRGNNSNINGMCIACCSSCPMIGYCLNIKKLQQYIPYISNHSRFDDAIEKPRTHFSTEEALRVGNSLGIDWTQYDVEQYRMGMDIELEHGRNNPHTNITNDDPIITGKIALAHLNEFPDYYTRLSKMEKEAWLFWNKKDEDD